MMTSLEKGKNMEESIKKEVAKLKEIYRAGKDAATSLEELAGGPVTHHYPVDLWSLSDSELDGEMGKRLGFLNEDIDCHPSAEITSHRRWTGPFIVRFKKLFFRMLRPYTDHLLARQVRFNEQLVAFHLASFIRFRRLEERVKDLEKDASEARERLDEIAAEKGSRPPCHE
jgi:hypothetical protein